MEYLQKKNDDKNIIYLDKLKLIYLNKLSKKYCISGNAHDFVNNKCIKCNIDISKYNFSEKELNELENNIENKNKEKILININKIKKNKKIVNNKNKKIEKFLNKFNNKFIKNSINIILSKFIDKLIILLGPKIKITKDLIYLKDILIIINHNYLGLPLPNPIEKIFNNDFFTIIKNHNLFKKDILYYKDKINNVYVYYDFVTFQYLGYSSDNINIIFIKNNVSLILKYSIKDSILLFGFENKYLNLLHFDNYIVNEELIGKIIRNRINNLKQILIQIQTLIYNIKNHSTNKNNIINEFTQKNKTINLTNKHKKKSIFKNYKYIISNININYNLPKTLEINNNYLNIDNINNLNNNDSKILFYIIYNFNKLLEYNYNIDMGYLLIQIIQFIFNLYYIPYDNYDIRKYDYLLLNDPPNIDENLKIVGFYQELLTLEEIDNPTKKENDYEEQEIKDAFDIDEYEYNDDFDETMDAFET